MKVHFDGFIAKWDESYGEHEWREKKLQPLHTKVLRSTGRTVFHSHAFTYLYYQMEKAVTTFCVFWHFVDVMWDCFTLSYF